MNTQLSVTQELLCDFCANALFDKEIIPPEKINVEDILNEAKYQTVFPIVCCALNKTDNKQFFDAVAKNTRINHNHIEIANLLSENGIEYVFIKGVASADYYKEPLMRTMGDVDVLIHPADIERVNELLGSIGYTAKDDISKTEKHIGFVQNSGGFKSVCEVHFKVNGIPDSLADAFNKYFDSIFESAKEIGVSNGKCLVPSTFHHGIILLLHTASHLTKEGVGLRHLCDWAVFVNGFSNDKFVNVFEKPLKELGLLRFAQLLTLCCERFLKTDPKDWAGRPNEQLLTQMLADIMNGGNFGFKDKDRYGQIKYINNRKNQSVSSKGAFLQLISSIDAKAKNECELVKKYKWLLPVGWVTVIFNYFVLVVLRKRKMDSVKTLKSANERKNIYDEFKLFEREE